MKTALALYFVFIYIGITSTQFLECESKEDCPAENAVCDENEKTCKCPLGQVHSSDGTSCLPIKTSIQAPCTDDNQCAWLLGRYKCESERCACEEGWRYLKGRCVKQIHLGHTCQTDDDCFTNHDIMSMKCIDNICKCATGYYERGNYDCRPESKLNDYCSLNSDCIDQDNQCIGSICKKPGTPKLSDTVKEVQTLIVFSDDMTDTSTSYEESNIKCNNGQCGDLANSVCYKPTDICICKRGFFYKSNECIPELGTPSGCEKNDECKIENAICKEGVCLCPNTYYYASNRLCQKPITHDNLFCNTKERCFVMGLHVACSNNICQCGINRKVDENFICKITGGGGPDNCNSDEECRTYIKNSECRSGRCLCREQYRLEGKSCLPNIGAPCDNSQPCLLKNSACTNDICACDEGYVEENEENCVAKSKGLHKECTTKVQCSSVASNSDCINRKCKCGSGFIEKNGVCLLHIRMGDTCTNIRQCTDMLGDSVMCINNKCQCSEDMKQAAGGKGCVPSSSPRSVQPAYIAMLALFYTVARYF